MLDVTIGIIKIKDIACNININPISKEIYYISKEVKYTIEGLGLVIYQKIDNMEKFKKQWFDNELSLTSDGIILINSGWILLNKYNKAIVCDYIGNERESIDITIRSEFE